MPAVIVPDAEASRILIYILVRLLAAVALVRVVYCCIQWSNRAREPKGGPELH